LAGLGGANVVARLALISASAPVEVSADRLQTLPARIERNKMLIRDETGIDVKKEVNFRMADLIDRYWEEQREGTRIERA
jgi:hypothetical protein